MLTFAMLALSLLDGPTAVLEPPFRVEAAGVVINVDGGHAAPLYADLDGDGVPDLLVGQTGREGARVYKNHGASGAPRFEGFTWFQARFTGQDPAEASPPDFSPRFADLDGDGVKDLVFGSDSPGDLFFAKGQGKGEYGPRRTLRNKDGEPARAGESSVVAVTDWDRDSDLDLVVGNRDGEVWLLPQKKRDAGVPVLGASRLLFPSPSVPSRTSEPSSVTVLRRQAAPCVADWDGDGVEDLLVGYADGSVHVWKSTLGEGGHRALSQPSMLIPSNDGPLVASWKNAEGDLVPLVDRSSGWARPAVADWNGDGRLDLLVGDHYRAYAEKRELTREQQAERSSLIERSRRLSVRAIEISDATREEARRRLGLEEDGWNEGFAKEQAMERAKLAELLEQDEEYRKVRGQLREIESRLTKLTRPYGEGGFVWVYLRKAAAIAEPK
jgi:hypothetical protein